MKLLGFRDLPGLEVSERDLSEENLAIDVCHGLLGDKAPLSIYNPQEATKGAHRIYVITDWYEFKTLDFRKIYEGMQKPAFIFNGRNVLDAEALCQIDFITYSIDKPLELLVKDLSASA